MTPHLASPHAVFAGTPPWRDTVIPPKAGGQHWLGTTLADLLVEPSDRSSGWLPAVYARLLVASSGPIYVGDQGPGGVRLERAGWLRCAPDSNFDAARRGCWPALPRVSELGLGVGSLAPSLVIVAERDPYDRQPMFARSGIWLFRALRILGYDELTVYVCNALDREQRPQGERLLALREAFSSYDPEWLALGPIAHEVLGLVSIQHKAAEHPGYSRRFAFAEGPAGFASKLSSAGLPEGPWSGHTLPASPGKAVLADRLGLPRSVAAPVEKETNVTVPPKLLEQVRTAFVLGEVATVKDAIKGIKKAKVRAEIKRLAKEQAWDAERDRYLSTKREKIKSSSADEEAKRISTSRGLAWSVFEKMLTKLDAEMNDPDVMVAPKDVKAMADVSLALSEKGDLSFDDEKKRLNELAPDAFQAELRRVMNNTFEPDKDKK